MVIIAAAAIGAAAVGVYNGGKAAVDHTKKKLGERVIRKNREQERREEQMQRESQASSLQAMSFEQRMQKYKRESGLVKNSQTEKKGRFRLLKG